MNIIVVVNAEAVMFLQMLEERHGLPIYQSEGLILDAIHKNPIIVIRGATGCGKTTQVPQYILDSYIRQGRGAECNIVVTQVSDVVWFGLRHDMYQKMMNKT